PRRHAGDQPPGVGGAFGLRTAYPRPARQRGRRDRAGRWRRPWRGGGARLRLAGEAGRAPRPHRAAAAGDGFQRHVEGSRAPHRGGRPMSIDIPGEPENLIAAAVDAAEEIRDPLDGVVERTATDPGAPFAPDALKRLAAMKKDDRAAFEVLRAR